MANEQISEITQVPTNAMVIKILNALIKRYNGLGTVYSYRGAVQTYDDLLAIQNPNPGDVYNVIQEDEEEQIAAGSNFAWDGTQWDNLGTSLSGIVQSVNGANPDSLGNVLLPLIKGVSVSGGNIVFTKNDNTTINVDNVKKLYTTMLGEGVDLNTLTGAGIYICGNNDYAVNYENCPIQKSFLLEVQISNDSNMIWQFLTQYNDGSTEAGNQYTRTYYNGNWSVWRMAGSGSNLTTYTSLEQLGITPGEETFAAIFNALPVNSEIIYYHNVNTDNLNDDFYPYGLGHFRAVKLSNDILAAEYIAYNLKDSTYNVASVWEVYYNYNYPNRTNIWNRHYSLQLDGTLVKTVNNIAPNSAGNVTIPIPSPTIATEAEAEAGTNNTKFMTPLRVAQAIEALDGNPIINASVSGRTITLTKKDGTKIKINTQDTNTGYVPNYAATISVPFPTSGAKFTAPSNGIYFCSFNLMQTTTISLNINGVNRLTRGMHSTYRENQPIMSIPLRAGDVIYWTSNATTVYSSLFVPYKLA